MRSKRQEAERKQAFEGLTTPHLKALYRFAVYKVQDANQAEDLVQETCLKAYRAFGQFARGSNYQAWLFRILLNTITDFQRQAAREPRAIALETPDSRCNLPHKTDGCHRLDPEQQVLARSFTAAVQAAIAKLPADWQSVVLLNFVAEWTYREIADLLGVPLGTVMSRLYRARRVLRQRLAHYLVDEPEPARPQTPAGKALVTPLDAVRKSATRSTREAR